jgi:BirA family biotin operon repressor/biotin-[acetyl-CoA-carboxylase] ligase
MTAVLEPTRNTGLIPLMAGVAVAETIRHELGLEALVKWPNDILIDKKKLGGVLVESAWSGGKAKNILLGVGVNVNNRLPPELPEATSLSSEFSENVSLEQFTNALLEGLSQRIKLLEKKSEDLIQAWKSMTSTLSKPVEVISDSDTVRGIAVNLDGEGALLVKTALGVKRIVSGSIRERYC